MSDFESFYDEFLRDVVGIKNPDYTTRMFFIVNYLMSQNNCYRLKEKVQQNPIGF
ncbi:MAG: hypothetical protein RMI79_04160 [Nitrososphaerota archaeon]|nr:hypothetical protein [Nitrososphaerota archaeon]